MPKIANPGEQEVLYPASATIGAATSILNAGLRWGNLDLGHHETQPQFLTIQLDHDPMGGDHSSPIYVKVKPALVRWLAEADTDDVALQTSQAMAKAHLALQDPRHPIPPEEYPRTFPVAIRDPRDVHLDVPGNSAGLDPSNTIRPRSGCEDEYRLIPHNVDSLKQQLTLLAGVAYIGQRALLKSADT